MNARTLLILIGIGFIGLVTRQFFWAFLAGIVFLFYALSVTGRSIRIGATKAKVRVKNKFNTELGEMEKVTGKYPNTLFEDAGKSIVEKINEHTLPSGAKSYHDATENYRWGMKDPVAKLGTAAQRLLDGLAKLFGK